MLSQAKISALIRSNERHDCHGLGRKKVCVRIEAIALLPTTFGKFQVVAFRNNRDNKEHVAFVRGDVSGKTVVPVRIHSECLTGDVAHSLRCDCHAQFVSAMRRIGKMRTGILIYLRQEGRGIGLINKIKAYMLQDNGLDTFEANQALGFKDDERDFAIAAHMLRSLKVLSVKLMTNNPHKITALEKLGVKVIARVPLTSKPGKYNRFYLETKEAKGGHILGTSLKKKNKR